MRGLKDGLAEKETKKPIALFNVNRAFRINAISATEHTLPRDG